MKTPLHRGFSLVELSIVLVILGLLVGGILAGQSLIKAAELRAIGTEQQRWTTALHAFRDKYFAVPGDFRDATRIWGRQLNDAACVTNSSAAVSAAGTCDGNADGSMQNNAAGKSGEAFQFWRQLALAGLIEGTYSGLSGNAGGNHATGGDNSPNSRFSGAIWSDFTYDNSANTVSQFFKVNYGNMLAVGAATTSNWGSNIVLTPEQAWNLDTKLDDGIPYRGKIHSTWQYCTTATALDDFTGTYALNNTNIRCALIFGKMF